MKSDKLAALRRLYVRPSDRFPDPTMEEKFLDFYRRPGLLFMRIALLIGIGAYVFFIAVEALYPAAQTEVVQQATRALMVAVLATLYYLMTVHRDWTLKNLAIVGGFGCLVIMLATASLIRAYSPETRHAVGSVMGSVMFATFLIYGLSRFPLKAAVFICAAGGVAFVYLSAPYIDSAGWVVRLVAQLAVTNIAGALMLAIAERRERSMFIQTMKLNEASERLANSASEAAEASEMKSRILAGVSHDMRQPMTGLAAHASALAMTGRDVTVEEARQRGSRMSTILTAMDEQLKKLIDIARSTAATAPRRLDRVDLNDVLQRVVTVYEEAAAQADVRLTLRRPVARNAFVYSNEDVLFEALSQIVFNAIKYSKGRPGAKVVIGVRQAAPATRICVYDNGVGIAPENLRRVFHPYFAVDTEESRPYHGRGLGLAQANSLVSSLPGHELSVESKHGRGSCFSIHAPHADTVQATAQSSLGGVDLERNEDKLHGAYVLLVENDANVAGALAESLESMGVVVDCCASYAAGVSALQSAERDYDAFVFDYELEEGHTGLQLIKYARRAVETPPTAILMSGDKDLVKALGPLPFETRFLPKPLIGSALKEALLEVIQATAWVGDDLRAAEQLAELREKIRTHKDTPNEESRQFMQAAYASLKALPKTVDATARAECLLDIAGFHYVDGHPESGIDAADDAVEWASQADNQALAARAYGIAGTMHGESYDFAGGVHFFARALEIAREIGDTVREARIWNNLGSCYETVGLQTEALEMFEKSAGLLPPGHQLEGIACTNIALIQLNLNELDKAVASAMKAIPHLEQAHTAHARHVAVQNYLTLVRANVGLRKLAEAQRWAAAAENIAAPSGSATTVMLANACGALAHIALGATQGGVAMMRDTVEMARGTNLAMFMLVADAATDGYELAGEAALASLLREEILDVERRMRSGGVLNHLRRMQSEQFVRTPETTNDHGTPKHGKPSSDSTVFTRLQEAAIGAELYSDEFGLHVFRVGTLAHELALAFGIEPEMCRVIEQAARLHDIGKAALPESLLTIKGKLRPADKAIMETHTLEGARLLREAGQRDLRIHIAEEIALAHHERWDGNGYPNRLKRTLIPITARVVALADAFDAMCHEQTYRQAWGIDDALREINQQAGKQFDPELTKVFVKLVPQLKRVHGDLEAYLTHPGRNDSFVRARTAIKRELRVA